MKESNFNYDDVLNMLYFAEQGCKVDANITNREQNAAATAPFKFPLIIRIHH